MRFAVQCGNCKDLLRVKQWKAQVFRLLSYSLFVTGLFVASEEGLFTSRWEVLGVSAMWLLVTEFLSSRMFDLTRHKHVANVTKIVKDQTGVVFHPSEGGEMKDFEIKMFKSQYLENERRLKEKDWVCKNCQQNNPPNFDVCWNCDEEYA